MSEFIPKFKRNLHAKGYTYSTVASNPRVHYRLWTHLHYPLQPTAVVVRDHSQTPVVGLLSRLLLQTIFYHISALLITLTRQDLFFKNETYLPCITQWNHMVNINITRCSPLCSVVRRHPSSARGSAGCACYDIRAIPLEDCLTGVTGARDNDPGGE
jgi:hypothetical protein